MGWGGRYVLEQFLSKQSALVKWWRVFNEKAYLKILLFIIGQIKAIKTLQKVFTEIILNQPHALMVNPLGVHARVAKVDVAV